MKNLRVTHESAATAQPPIWILADVRCRTSDVRHRIIPMLHTMSYVWHVRHRTHTTSYLMHVRHRKSMSYVWHIRHRNIRCRTCIRYRMSHRIRHRMIGLHIVRSCIQHRARHRIRHRMRCSFNWIWSRRLGPCAKHGTLACIRSRRISRCLRVCGNLKMRGGQRIG